MLRWRKIDLSSQEREPAPFIVGVTRSGTTLLRLMLDSHPELTIPPETHFTPEGDQTRQQGRSGREEDLQGVHQESPLGRLRSRRRHFQATPRRAWIRSIRNLGDALLLRPLREGEGQAALGGQDPRLPGADEADLEGAARGAIRARDPRRPRRRAVAVVEVRAADPGRGGGQALAAARQARTPDCDQDSGRVHRGPLRGPRARIPRRRSGGCASS